MFKDTFQNLWKDGTLSVLISAKLPAGKSVPHPQHGSPSSVSPVHDHCGFHGWHLACPEQPSTPVNQKHIFTFLTEKCLRTLFLQNGARPAACLATPVEHVLVIQGPVALPAHDDARRDASLHIGRVPQLGKKYRKQLHLSQAVLCWFHSTQLKSVKAKHHGTHPLKTSKEEDSQGCVALLLMHPLETVLGNLMTCRSNHTGWGFQEERLEAMTMSQNSPTKSN